MRAGLALAAFLTAASGVGAPAQDPDWHIPRTPPSAAETQRPDAVRLREALARYQVLAAAGGWQTLLTAATLHSGQRDPTVAALRERLRTSGDFSGLPGTADAWFFDAGLQRSLQDFQTRHGLPASGVTDKRTLLNASITFTDAEDRYFVRVYGHNLTDEVYRVGELPVAALWTMSYYGEPRAFGLEIGLKFRDSN